ncbi:MAG: ATP-binding cassette domain-containing protein [Actinobacteria bacterium]|nr:ATP-binding cassette domain-containing protein [Actinomycetota bacterium]
MDGRLFEFHDVVVERGGRRILDGLCGHLPDHGITVITGPSGSGKSTLLRLANALEVPTSGSVELDGTPLADLDPLALRRSVGMVFQQPTALPGTVADNLRTGQPDADDAEIDAALARVGLAGFADRDADSLSGGEAQRMSLARTLGTGPRYLLLDEPTSALDHASTDGIEELVTGLADEGVPSAWVTHDLAQLRRLAHHVVFVIDGVVAQEGDVADVLDAPTPAVERFLSGATS